MHTLLDLRGNIPSFIHISDGKLHDVHALDMLLPEAGAIYVMDRGYVDFARLYRLHQAGAFFVTRAKSNLNAHRVYSAATDRTTGVIADQNDRAGRALYKPGLPGASPAGALQGPGNRQTLVFLTNQTAQPALTICDLYKSRWQAHDSPHLSDRPENVCEQRLLLQHAGETLHQRTQPGFRHRRDQIVEHAALTEQRMDAALGGVGLEHPVIAQRLAGGAEQRQQHHRESVDQP